MPINLRDTDIAVLNALLKDGRKSFRQISKDTGLSTPTVKNRFNRLVNLGIIKSISPILDFGKIINYTYQSNNDKSADLANFITRYNEQHRKLSKNKKEEGKDFDIQIDKRTVFDNKCDYCKTPIVNKMYLFKLANLERFFLL